MFTVFRAGASSAYYSMMRRWYTYTIHHCPFSHTSHRISHRIAFSTRILVLGFSLRETTSTGMRRKPCHVLAFVVVVVRRSVGLVLLLFVRRKNGEGGVTQYQEEAKREGMSDRSLKIKMEMEICRYVYTLDPEGAIHGWWTDGVGCQKSAWFGSFVLGPLRWCCLLRSSTSTADMGNSHGNYDTIQMAVDLFGYHCLLGSIYVSMCFGSE